MVSPADLSPLRWQSKRPGGAWLSSSIIIRNDVSASSARPLCVISVGLMLSRERVKGTTPEKQEIKVHNNTFYQLLQLPCMWKCPTQDTKTQKKNTKRSIFCSSGFGCLVVWVSSLLTLFASSSAEKYEGNGGIFIVCEKFLMFPQDQRHCLMQWEQICSKNSSNGNEWWNVICGTNRDDKGCTLCLKILALVFKTGMERILIS